MAGDVDRPLLPGVLVAVVAVVVGLGDLRRGARCHGAGHAQRPQDEPLQLLGERTAGDALGHQPGQHVVGVGVAPVRPRREPRRLGQRQPHQLLGPVGVEPVLHPLLAPPGDPGLERPVRVELAGVVEDPAGVLQQHPYGDPPVEAEPGQVVGHGGVQADPALGHQHEHRGRDEALGDAADAEVPVGQRLGVPAQFAHPGAADPLAPPVVHPQLHAEDTGLDDLLDRLLQFGAIRPLDGKDDGHDCSSDGAAPDSLSGR